MMTLQRFTAKPPDVPMSAVWYLADLGEAKGSSTSLPAASPFRNRNRLSARKLLAPLLDRAYSVFAFFVFFPHQLSMLTLLDR